MGAVYWRHVTELTRMRRVALFPATFDPPTLGHMETIARSAAVFDEIVVAVYAEPAKATLFTVAERLALVEASVLELGVPNVRVRSYSAQLTVELARAEGASALIRGLRAVSDFDYELQLAHTNKVLAPDIETVVLLASAKYSFLSSTIVREVARLGGDVSPWVPRAVAVKLAERFGDPHAVPPTHSVLGSEAGADRIAGFVTTDDRVR